MHRTTGEVFRTIDTAIDPFCRARDTAPVLPGDGTVVLLVPGSNWNDALIRHDVAAGTLLWRVTGSFANSPVVANGVVYVVNTDAGQLQARSLATGTVQWTWALPEPIARDSSNKIMGNLVVTDNLIFVGTSARTYAVDLQSHAAVWNSTRTGNLAISSNRVLYIATTGYVSSNGPLLPGRIDAINLAGP
jgi:outer membrane protein assembly factor BamB